MSDYRLKHIMPRTDALGWFATYTLAEAPFGSAIPLLYWALRSRDGEDEIAGFLVNGDVVAADEPPEGATFQGYQFLGRMSPEEFEQYLAELQNYGQALAAERVTQSQPAPESASPSTSSEQPQPRKRSKRQRGARPA